MNNFNLCATQLFWLESTESVFHAQNNKQCSSWLETIRIKQPKPHLFKKKKTRGCRLEVMWEYSCWKFDSCLIYLHVDRALVVTFVVDRPLLSRAVAASVTAEWGVLGALIDWIRQVCGSAIKMHEMWNNTRWTLMKTTYRTDGGKRRRLLFWQATHLKGVPFFFFFLEVGTQSRPNWVYMQGQLRA